MASLRKSVLITGCSAGGIGAALAHVFQEKGYHVFASARNPTKIPATLSGAANVTSLTLDVLSPSSIAAAVDSVQRKTGSGLDVLINNSGGGYTVPALDASLVKGKELFELNFWAPLAMLQAFAPLLIKAKGCVVNNTSANAYIPMPLMSMYNSSKAALAMASETWRHELQPLGVRTITLVTCAVKTNFFADYHPAELPETSKYSDIRDFIHNLTDGRMQRKAISSREYAISVVREVEKGTVGTVWAGTDASMARLAWWLSPQWIFDMIVQSVIPLSKEMAKATQKKEN
ncbi:Short-chain dehydrogenase cctT [Lachnellula hyalina]|uniref:Short-chain dehydrogenase cctT n=1 Tax=Lachnellula hyalina TaxID=1316788 RepID=A0A8H8TY36_9HELO|nr:Short-chain dehydrogenase cctT [Lachnellula hyalina]TVY24502.1 Short-chain dehydrogenase cctT [Lachnellula hyalina]